MLDEYDIIGYFIAHPYSIHKYPPNLHNESHLITEQGHQYNDWFIHDMVIYPGYHKKGLGTMMYNFFIKTIPNNSSMSLVAVNGAYKFWKKQGFYVQPLQHKNALKSYTKDAVFMIRNR